MRQYIKQVVEGGALEATAMESAIDTILQGEATPAQIAAFITALRMKGETAEELAAAARVMRRRCIPVALSSGAAIMDTCGTGGDGSNSFNISTVSALVVAACGVRVAKHGNRAATSRCGSADVLEALGVDLDMSPERIGECIESVGIGFMFARAHHPAMRHAAPVRAELGIRTLFNLLGPLSNPAGATHQLLGLGDGSKVKVMAEVLAQLGSQAAWVVHGAGGLDEVSLSGPTRVVRLRDGAIDEVCLTPEDFGVEAAPASTLVGGDAKHNAAITRAILGGETGPRRDAVLINSAAALCVVGEADSPRAAVQRAAAALDAGKVETLLGRWVEFSGG